MDACDFAFAAEFVILRSGDFKVSDQSGLVSIFSYAQRAARGVQRLLFRREFLLQQFLRGEIVFDLLERAQNILTIVGDGFFVSSLCATQVGSQASAFKNWDVNRGTDCPDAAGSVEQGAGADASEAGEAVDANGWKERGFGDADARIRGGHATFRCGDVRPAFKEFGWNARWNLGRIQSRVALRQHE